MCKGSDQIPYGLESTVFVDGLCVAIDRRVDTPEEYIMYALFSLSRQLKVGSHKQ